jgi:hypothetical protein
MYVVDSDVLIATKQSGSALPSDGISRPEPPTLFEIDELAGVDPGGRPLWDSARVKNRRAAARSRRSEASTSIPRPNWSIARHRRVHLPANFT